MRNKKLNFILVFVSFAALLLAGCGGGGGEETAPLVDSTAPKVESYYPDPTVNGDGNVTSADIQTNGIKVIFDEGMDPTTIGPASFKVEEWYAEEGRTVRGTITYDSKVRTAKFIPDTALSSYYSYYYVVTITTSVTDLAGNNLAADYSWLFTVGEALFRDPLGGLGGLGGGTGSIGFYGG